MSSPSQPNLEFQKSNQNQKKSNLGSKIREEKVRQFFPHGYIGGGPRPHSVTCPNSSDTLVKNTNKKTKVYKEVFLEISWRSVGSGNILEMGLIWREYQQFWKCLKCPILGSMKA